MGLKTVCSSLSLPLILFLEPNASFHSFISDTNRSIKLVSQKSRDNANEVELDVGDDDDSCKSDTPNFPNG
jgi:hypothetical protein